MNTRRNNWREPQAFHLKEYPREEFVDAMAYRNAVNHYEGSLVFWKFGFWIMLAMWLYAGWQNTQLEKQLHPVPSTPAIEEFPDK